MSQGKVISVSKSASHTFSKVVCSSIDLIKEIGVEGDAHSGEKVKHRSRVAKDPNQPNLRQVHLIHSELFDELREKGYRLQNGELGENITTLGIDLLGLPEGAILHIGNSAQIKITGLRNPCKQLDNKAPGLMKAVLDKDEEGNLIRKAGIMGIVLEGGRIAPGDEIKVVFPDSPFIKLERV